MNRHDILTGSLPDGTAALETCGNWTMGGAEGAAIGGQRSHRLGRLCGGQVVEFVTLDAWRL